MHRTHTLRAAVISAAVALPVTMAVAEPNPYARADDSWISISGTVVAPSAEAFSLDYGDGVILVEMDDWDNYGDAYGLMDGDKVTVYGRVDDDLFDVASIEAGSVYVEALNTYFYASSDDEEDDYLGYVWSVSTPILTNYATLRGTVTSIDRSGREFTLDSGSGQITVEADALGYNPLDDLGYQQIEQGDKVSVAGTFDADFLEGRVFEADSVVTLSDASNKAG